MIADLTAAAALVLGAYLIGSVPIGLLFARRRGMDIRQVGSGNIGATNVARNLGKRLGAVVLVLDAVKGAVPVLICLGLGFDRSVDPFVLTATGFAAVAGHCFPIWLAFNGGKGVATSLGVFLVVDPLATGAVVALFAAIYAATRIVSIGSMAGAIAFPAALLIRGASDAEVTLGIAVALVVLYRHKGNLSRLLQRREHRV